MDYKKSRDAVWQMLAKIKAASLPISVERICKAEKIRFFAYSKAEEKLKRCGLEEYAQSNDAFTFSRMIFFDDRKPLTRQRFSIAHEIGHIVLHEPIEATVYNREISPSDNPLEAEANVFASRLLAPLCILHYLGLDSPEEIAEVCRISQIAAEIRYRRLCEIRERDRRMRETKGYGCFLLSSYEKEVFRNFERYIEKNKKR